jgi:circadian clock protein KaiC
VAAEHRQEGTHERVNSGVRELDQLLGGGLERGTSTLLTGAAGTGKSTLAASFATAAAKRGERAAFFIFDESTNTLLTRTDGMGIDMRSAVDAGRISVRQIDPAELSPGELSHAIRDAVEQDDARIVVIDSLNGYLNSMPEERFLTIQLHEVLTYLGQRGVATLLISAHQGLLGPMNSPVDASYLADAIVLLRYYEAEGEVRQAISVVKKRGGQHERTIRDFRLTSDGVRVGEPLRDYRGVLTGVPERVRRS